MLKPQERQTAWNLSTSSSSDPRTVFLSSSSALVAPNYAERLAAVAEKQVSGDHFVSDANDSQMVEKSQQGPRFWCEGGRENGQTCDATEIYIKKREQTREMSAKTTARMDVSNGGWAPGVYKGSHNSL